MKIIFFITIFYSTLFANLSSDLHKIDKMYENKKFLQACKFGTNKIINYRKSEPFISIYAFSCLEADQIDKLAVATALLKHSAEARANSLLLATIILQKKLLLHALIDGFKAKNLHLPSTEFILSKVFDLFMKEQEKRDIYQLIDEKNPNETYKLYLKHDKRNDKIVIEHYINHKLVKIHKYW